MQTYYDHCTCIVDTIGIAPQVVVGSDGRRDAEQGLHNPRARVKATVCECAQCETQVTETVHRLAAQQTDANQTGTGRVLWSELQDKAQDFFSSLSKYT